MPYFPSSGGLNYSLQRDERSSFHLSLNVAWSQWMLIVIHNYSPVSLDKQLQTSRLFPNGSLLFPAPGLVVTNAFATKWVAESSEGVDERWEAKEKQGITIFFHTAILVLKHAWLFAGKMNIPWMLVWTSILLWECSGTVNDKGHGYCHPEHLRGIQRSMEVSSQMLQLSCCSSPAPPPKSSHSPPLSFPLIGEFGEGCGDLVTNISLGCEDEHLDPWFSPDTAWTIWESWTTSGFTFYLMKYRV